MPQTNESHLDVQVGNRQSDKRPFHFSPPTEEDRIRKVFDLPDDAPLPLVREETLARYYEHLIAHLSMPFDALYCQNGGEMRQLIHYVQVTDLIDPRHNRNHTRHGLVCKARNHKAVLELPLAECGVREENPNCQLIDDYAYWFVNWR